MGKRITYDILGEHFPSKQALHARIVAIRDSYPDGKTLGDQHFSFMYRVLLMHQWADEKIGCGVDSMFVMTHREYRNRGFWLRRPDGTESDWSFVKCLTRTTPLTAFRAACRRSVLGQVLDFKARALASGVVCPFTGVPLTRSNSHVDHAPPNEFVRLVDAFLANMHIDPAEVPMHGWNTGNEDGRTFVEFVDKGLSEAFAAFHASHARLRLISAQANLSLPKAVR